jgi:peroxiredoxin
MKTILSLLLLAACPPCFAQPPAPVTPSSPPAVEQSLDDTLIRISGEQVKALEAYLTANSKADGGNEDLKELVAHYGLLAEHYRWLGARANEGDHLNRLLDVLERQYYFMAKRVNPDLDSIVKNICTRFLIVWKGPRATPEEQKNAQAIFDQCKRDLPKLKDHWKICDEESKLKLPRVGESMPIQFTALDGSKVDTAALKGKAVLVYSWESSQHASLKWLPSLKAMYQKFHDKGLEVIGLPMDKDEAALRAFIKKENIQWPQDFDGKGWQNEVAVKYGMSSLSVHFILGKDGKVADYTFGDPSELEAKVAELLK